MSQLRPAPSLALLRHLGAAIRPPLAKQQTNCAARACQQLRYASTNETPPGNNRPNFKGQLFESIQSRLERDKVERARIIADRAARAGPNYAAQTFMVIFAGAVCFYLGTQYPRELSPDSTLPLASARAPQYQESPKEFECAWADFVNIVGEENVSTAESDRASHADSDWSTYRRNTTDPDPFCIVYPSSTEQVSRIMKICHLRRIPVTGYSGGTSLEGHYTPKHRGICIDFSHMDKVLNLHKEDMDVVVQPGVGWEDLNEDLAKNNLFFPPDPGPGARIGGMIGTGCSGTNAYRYGTMREWVLSLTVVLADGTIIKTRQRPRKSSAGYDLTKLFIGNEGTLGLITEATLKLTTKPQSTSVAVCSFESIRQAADCVGKVVGNGVPIAAVEILDDDMMRAINLAGATKRSWKESPTLFFKFAGTASGVKEQIAIVRDLAKSTGSKGFEFAKSADEATELWSARKEALWSTMAMKKNDGDFVWTGDVAVPISRLPDIIEETKKDIKESGLVGTIVGHVGDGNFHSIICYGPEERKIAEEVVHRMVKRAVEMEGTVTGEHGVGLVKRDYLPHELGVTTVDAMRKIKQALDPLGILNPEKVVRMARPKYGEVAEW